MKSAIGKLIITMLATVMLAESSYAQATGGGSGGGRKRHEQKADKPTAQTPKADEKAYNATFKSFRINLSILGAARAEKAGPHSSCRNGAADISAAVVYSPSSKVVVSGFGRQR